MNSPADKLYEHIVGDWRINRNKAKPGNNLVRDIGLLPGRIVFYPTNTFMYQNKNGRFTGSWDISESMMPASGIYQGEIYTESPAYPVCALNLSFRDEWGYLTKNVSMQMVYARNKKIKLEQTTSLVNVLKR